MPLMTGDSAEHVIGYDARVWSTDAPGWLEQRRTQYLLRPDVSMPLSTDDAVWPTMFDIESDSAASLTRPQWTGRNGGLWDDLGRLTQCLEDAWGATWPPCRLVAVTVAYGPLSADQRAEWDERTTEVTPAVPSPEWDRLGYDVSDDWLLSGLSNCGYHGDEVGPMRERWGRHLNEYGLFDDAGTAGEFMTVTDERVEEHAPFFVYGLYSVER